MLWLVWQERNALIFEDKVGTLEHLKCLLFRTLFFGLVFGGVRTVLLYLILFSISFSS